VQKRCCHQSVSSLKETSRDYEFACSLCFAFIRLDILALHLDRVSSYL
jgi:hypothetical protein